MPAAFSSLKNSIYENHENWSEMGPYGSVGAHIKTGRSPMAQDHFKTPPDPKMVHTNMKNTQQSWLGKNYFLTIFDFYCPSWGQAGFDPEP